MKYKVGDKVKLVDYKFYLYNCHWRTKVWYLLGGLAMNEEMSNYCGQIMTITSAKTFGPTECYTFKECNKPFCWSVQLIEKKI